jgi:ankyrin repeat protein
MPGVIIISGWKIDFGGFVMRMREFVLLAITLVAACILYPIYPASGINSSVDTAKRFLDAVEAGDTAEAKSYLDKDPCLVAIGDIRYKAGGLTPVLHMAIDKNRPDIVKLLLSRGADVNSKNPLGELGPLHVAAGQGRSEIIPILISFGADPDGKRGNFRFSPLCFASNADVAEILINYGADVHLRNENGFTPLHLLAEQGKVEAAEALLKHGAEIDARDKWGKTPLHYASEYGQADMVEFLLEKGAAINARDERGMTAINRAVQPDFSAPREARKKCVELLIPKGADYTISDAVWLGDSAKVEQLLKNNPSLANSAVLLIAVKEKHANVAELLIKSGADLDANLFGTPLLHISANGGNIGVVKVLLDNGADINQRGAYGELALHWAATKGRIDVVGLLLDAGSEINIAAVKQRGDIDLIVEEEVNPVAEELKSLEQTEAQIKATRAGSGLQVMGRPRVVFAIGDTSLHSAAQWGHNEIVKLLVSRGADINAPNKFGESPLHYACVFRHREIVRILLEAGADVNTLDNKGYSPLWLASSPPDSKDEQIIKMLAARGAIK